MGVTGAGGSRGRDEGIREKKGPCQERGTEGDLRNRGRNQENQDYKGQRRQREPSVAGRVPLVFCMDKTHRRGQEICTERQ